jgi:hypothetical protein
MVNNSYEIKCIKQHVQGSGLILNLINKIRGVNSNRYPMVFQNSNSENQKQNIPVIKKNIKKYLSGAYKVISKLPIEKKTYSEYGLFFTIKRLDD